MVFQSYALFPHMSVLENVRYGLVVSGRAEGRRPTSARAPRSATVGLTGFDARLPSELSGGQQQRVAVARALVLEPARAAVRRAAVESRRAAAPADARGDPRPAAAAVADRRLRHARPGRGDGGVRPHHRDEQGGDRAGRRAARALRAAARRVRRRLHGRRQSRARHARRGATRTLGDVRARRRRRCALPHRGLPDGDVDVVDPARSDRRCAAAATRRSRGTVRKAAYLGGVMEYTLDTAIGELFVVSHRRRPAARGRHRRSASRSPTTASCVIPPGVRE